MDKKWMNVDRRSKEYENGVLEFVKFAVEHVKDVGRMKCPCLGCCYGGPVSTYEAMKKLVDTVIQVFRAQRGSQVPKSKANNITWIQVEYPGQRNEVDCGFYMLQFMKEILLSNQIEIPSKYFDDFKCATYSKSKLDELKEEWCQFMIGLKVV
ncbi:uncharacterized protein LOC131652075 [Vicia villosa]|uniref:uncharacterized protein LOC131652075 n=1 Tax=Vicia villosa TaxID=3911 RepID=UPI00273B9F3E|nr:uncharacterized protein LOC131652075 [Vicia villosa]